MSVAFFIENLSAVGHCALSGPHPIWSGTAQFDADLRCNVIPVRGLGITMIPE